jgi:hypothetical protein
VTLDRPGNEYPLDSALSQATTTVDITLPAINRHRRVS